MAATSSWRDRRASRVLLVGNYPPDQQASMLRFGRTLFSNLRTLGVDVDLVEPATVFGRLAPHVRPLARLFGYLDKYLLFPLALRLRAARYGYVHILDHSNAPYRSFAGPARVILTCHDLFAVQVMLGEVPGEAFGWSGRLLQKWVLRSLQRVDRFTSVSARTAAELRRLTGTEAPIDVIPNALPDAFFPPATAESDLALTRLGLATDQPFFLHVGGNSFYKNRAGALRIFEQLALLPIFRGHILVLAGKAPDAGLQEKIVASPIRTRVRVVADPDDHGLRALYGRAEALLFPSLKEGFGWPIIEAQACGCLVATTDAEPMRGVAGGAAILIDSGDPAAAAAAIAAATGRAESLREAGLCNAARYAPEQVFSQYLPLYGLGTEASKTETVKLGLQM